MPTRWDIIGHGDVTEQLAEAAASRTPGHAYLFSGPRHLGKATVARKFAEALLCERGEGCGTCSHCLLMASGNHPDLIELPRDDKLTIAQVRELRHALTLKPHSAAFRVGIVPDAERLGIPAQNALLKLLEEPPPKTVLILTAPSAGHLLPTTVSRCRQLRFTRPAAADLAMALADHGTRAAEAVRAGGRRPGLALRLLEDPEQLARQEAWGSMLLEALDADTPGRMRLAKRIGELDNPGALVDHWLALHQQALRAEVGAAAEATPVAVELAKRYAPAQLRHHATQLLAARKRLSYNPNVVLLMERTLLELGES